MLLLICFFLSLLLFRLDLSERLASSNSVVFYQLIFGAMAALNLFVLLAPDSWEKRFKSFLSPLWGGGNSEAARKPIVLTRLAAFLLAAGVILNLWGAREAVLGIFKEPVDGSGSTASAALMRAALQRLDDGSKIYEEPYDLGGWTSELIYAPGLVRFHAWVRGLDLDGRWAGVLGMSLVGAAALGAGIALMMRRRQGAASNWALMGAGLLALGSGLWSSGLTTRLFVIRDPSCAVWAVAFCAGLAAAARSWLAGGLLLGMASAAFPPFIFLAPIYLIGAYSIRKGASGPSARSGASSLESGSSIGSVSEPASPAPIYWSAVPNLAIFAYLLIVIGAIWPHWRDLGRMVEAVIHSPFKAGQNYSDQNVLGQFPGLAWLFCSTGLNPLSPVIFLILWGEIVNRSRFLNARSAVRLPRLLALAAFLSAIFSPKPMNLSYWSYLAFLLAAGIGQVWEDSATDESPERSASSSSSNSSSIQWGLAASGGVLALMLIFCAFTARFSVDDAWMLRRPNAPASDASSWNIPSMVRSGFHKPDPEIVWMDGVRSVAALPVVHPQSGRLVLDIQTVEARTRSYNIITIEFNGQTLGEVQTKTGTGRRISFSVARDEWVRGCNTLVLRAMWAEAPSRMMTGSQDERKLAYGLKAISWEPEPPGGFTDNKSLLKPPSARRSKAASKNLKSPPKIENLTSPKSSPPGKEIPPASQSGSPANKDQSPAKPETSPLNKDQSPPPPKATSTHGPP